MSEQSHTANHEQQERLVITPEHQERLREHQERQEKSAEQSKHEQHELLQQARQELQGQTANADPIERLRAAEAATQPAAPQTINRELKAITLRRELQHIRRKLPVPERALSKVIHQPVVRAVSEGAGKTISRPSGLLGGGLVAFLGTGSYYLFVRHMGYHYDNAVSFALFFGGFALGIVIELFVYASTGSHRQRAD
jgi:hypothetical protein